MNNLNHDNYSRTYKLYSAYSLDSVVYQTCVHVYIIDNDFKCCIGELQQKNNSEHNYLCVRPLLIKVGGIADHVTYSQ